MERAWDAGWGRREMWVVITGPKSIALARLGRHNWVEVRSNAMSSRD